MTDRTDTAVMDRTALVRRGRKIELLRLSLWFLLSPKRVLTRCGAGL